MTSAEAHLAVARPSRAARVRKRDPEKGRVIVLILPVADRLFHRSVLVIEHMLLLVLKRAEKGAGLVG